MRQLLGLLLACFLAALPLRAQPSSDEVATVLDQVLARHDVARHALVGIHVLDLKSGASLYQRNAHSNFVPASTAKLFSTAAALDRLGPAFRFTTPLWSTAAPREGVIDGDLVLVGSGDPSFSGPFHEGKAEQPFSEWADSLLEAGVRRITGDVVVSGAAFAGPRWGKGWSWDDIPYYYSPELSALSFAENRIELNVSVPQRGGAPRVRWSPLDSVGVRWSLDLSSPQRGRSDVDFTRTMEANHFLISGTLPAGHVRSARLAVHDPDLFFARALLHTLRSRGIQIDGDPRVASVPDSLRRHRLALYRSPPLVDIVRETNKGSNNLFAEMLLRAGALWGGAPAQRSRSVTAAQAVDSAWVTFEQAGIPQAELDLVDGSGLSRMNVASPAALTRLLAYMHDHPSSLTAVSFRSSLPVAGVDGTLERRMETVEGRVRAKTGTLTHVSALAGYVDADGERPLAFAVLLNNHATSAGPARRLQDDLVQSIARMMQKERRARNAR